MKSNTGTNHLLLLHGALGSSKQFQSILPGLNQSFNVITLDFEGHGGKEIIRDYSIDHFVENVQDLLEQFKEPIKIFGYSMGGYVALKAALKRPNKIQKIATLGTKFDWSKESTAKEVRMLNPTKIAEKVPQFAQKLAAEHHPQDWKAVVEQTAIMMNRLAQGEKLSDKDFAAINTEVVIGLGSLDHMVSLKESQKVVEQLSQATLHYLDGVKHPIEQVKDNQLFDYITQSLH